MQRGVHGAAPGAGREHDALDQAADGGGGLIAFAGVVQGVGETRHLAPVYAGDVRMDVGDVGGPARKAGYQFILARFQFAYSANAVADIGMLAM